MKAVWNGVVVAQSDDVVLFEGEHYFPAASVRQDCLLSSNRRTMCSVKGESRYYTLFVDGDANPDAAWYVPEPKEGALAIQGRVAFVRSVKIED